jgi:uncharacterized protein (TIGR02285 family)
MATRRRLLGLLVAALLLQDAAGAAPPVVTWVTPDLSNDTNNFANHYLSFLMGRLPGFDHRVMQGSFGRVWHEMQSNRLGTCVFSALKTPEREAVAVFSRRPLLWPAYRLYFLAMRREAFAPYLDGGGHVDLGKLNAAQLHGGVTASRAYNSVIDGFITARGKARPLDSLLSTRQILNLLRAGRLDYAFATQADIEQTDGVLDSLPIAGAEAWNPSFVACTRDKTGQAVIAALDHVFEDQESWAEFVEPLRAVLPAADYAVVLRSKP